ncbi:MAG: hypothetical protein ACRDL7_01585 [Gaiellaceae bacterium]
MFIGFPQDQAGSLVFIPSTRQIVVSADVAYDESFSSAIAFTEKPFHDALSLRPSVSFVSRPSTTTEMTGDIITFAAPLEEGNTEITNRQADAESDEVGTTFSRVRWVDKADIGQGDIFTPPPVEDAPPADMYDDGGPSEENNLPLIQRGVRREKATTRLTYNQLGETAAMVSWRGTFKACQDEDEWSLIIEC